MPGASTTETKRRRGAPCIPIEERFWPKVNKLSPDGCWLWTGSINSKGHGNFWVERKTEAHRISYKMAYGKIPWGMCVLQRCGVRACVNPVHLYLRYGPNNTKLTAADAAAIRTSREYAVVLAERYGVSRALINCIRIKRRWGNEWHA